MVARSPPKQRKMVAAGALPLLNPLLIRETVNKVDKCMARLQELQYTVTGGSKLVSGVNLSPRSTRVYLRTSLRCKQESIRIKNGGSSKSPTGKFPQSKGGEWRRMSLPGMLVGETVGEILQATQFARDIVSVVTNKSNKITPQEDPKTPITQHRFKQKPKLENDTRETILAKRKKEKQQRIQQSTGFESSSPPRLGRARSRIQFKVSPPPNASKKKDFENGKENAHYLANRVSPRNRPWVKKTVLFPNPLFTPSKPQQQQKNYRTGSPVIARNKQTPHKFFIKSPVKIKSPRPLGSISPTRPANPSKKLSPKRFKMCGSISSTRPANPSKKLSPKLSKTRGSFSPSRLVNKLPSPSKLRRSFSPSRLAKRLVSPLKRRNSFTQKNDELISGLRQRPFSIVPMQFTSGRI